MIADELPAWTPSQIENDSKRLLECASWEVSTIPNLETLAQDYCDASISCLRGLIPFGVEACVCRNRNQGRKYRILVDSSIADGVDDARFRIVLAEEISHVRLHDLLIASVDTTDDFVELHSRSEWRRVEREAKRFSRALCMPASRMKLEIEAAYVETLDRLGFVNCDTMLASIYWRIASVLCVPQPEVISRISEMPGDYLNRIAGSLVLRHGTLLGMPQLLAIGAETETRITTQLQLFPKERV